MSAFVDLTNIDRAVPILSVHGAFEVVLRLAEPLPKAMRLGPRDVKLHCVPAINVHRIAPMVFSLDGGRCPIDPPRPGMQVYDVRSVRLLREQQAARTASPYIAFSSGTATVDDEPPILFSVDRIPSVTGADPFVFVALESTADLGLFESAEVDFEVTDGVRPERLGVGEISERVAGSPSGLTFRNVLPVTRTAAPAFDGDRLWRWLQLLKATLPQLVIPHQLAASVALANHPAWAHWPDAKATVDSFQGIASVQLGRPSGRDDAAVEVLVDVEPSTFAGSGDLDVFGERIADLLASTLRPHESVALTLRDTSHEVLLRYASIAGTKEGL